MNITKTVTALNEYGCGFEATVGLNSYGRVELDIAYIADGVITDQTIGILLDSEAARTLSNYLSDISYKAEAEELTNG